MRPGSRDELLKQTTDLLRSVGARAVERLGQHFLIDEGILRRQVAYAGVEERDAVLEIGAGTGNLTARLLEKAGRVIAVEKDPRLVRLLERRFSRSENLQLIHGDALEIAIPPFDKCVSNIPFAISSPLTFELLKRDFRTAVLTYQKEFAERMVATPGGRQYSRLSVATYCRARARILEYIPSDAFYPRPKVSSAMVELRPKEKPFEVDDEIFQRVLTGLFAHRRKSIVNSLYHSSGYILQQDLSKEARKTQARELIPERLRERRVYQLTPDEFAEIARIIEARTQQRV